MRPLVEEHLGGSHALQVERMMVVFLRRPGGQSQFSAAIRDNLRAFIDKEKRRPTNRQKDDFRFELPPLEQTGNRCRKVHWPSISDRAVRYSPMDSAVLLRFFVHAQRFW
jgi:hypothetical protein